MARCPASPNCVSTQANDTEHTIKSFPIHGSIEHSLQQLQTIVLSYPRIEIVDQEAGYLHAVFYSFLFGFPDDVEFLADENTGTIEFRSASRLGYSDLGVNRARMEEIRRRYLAQSER